MVKDPFTIVKTRLGIDPGQKDLPLISVVEEAVRDIIRDAPEFGLINAYPQIEGFAHLVRLLVEAHRHTQEGVHITGFLRLQLMEIESLMQRYPGDRAAACQSLGRVIAAALDIMGAADTETYRVPAAFRTDGMSKVS